MAGVKQGKTTAGTRPSQTLVEPDRDPDLFNRSDGAATDRLVAYAHVLVQPRAIKVVCTMFRAPRALVLSLADEQIVCCLWDKPRRSPSAVDGGGQRLTRWSDQARRDGVWSLTGQHSGTTDIPLRPLKGSLPRCLIGAAVGILYGSER